MDTVTLQGQRICVCRQLQRFDRLFHRLCNLGMKPGRDFLINRPLQFVLIRQLSIHGIKAIVDAEKGLIWQDVFLPEFTPSDWKDRSVLWNAVEKNEKTKDSRLAREFVPALPIELTPSQWQELLTDFIQNNFVADGMCADVAVHDPYPPGHNPHAHIMVTVRPLDEKGTGSTRPRKNKQKIVSQPNRKRKQEQER